MVEVPPVTEGLARGVAREVALTAPSQWTNPGMPEFTPKLAEILTKRQEPVVIKASGLAAGKGVVVCATTAEALANSSL